MSPISSDAPNGLFKFSTGPKFDNALDAASSQSRCCGNSAGGSASRMGRPMTPAFSNGRPANSGAAGANGGAAQITNSANMSTLELGDGIKIQVSSGGTGSVTVSTNGVTRNFELGPDGMLVEVGETAPVTSTTPEDAGPDDAGSITGVLRGDPDFEILTAALDATGLTGVIGDESALTVLAPTDEAFRILAQDSLGFDVNGLSDAEVATLLVDTLGESVVSNILQYHVAPGVVNFEEITGQNDPFGSSSFTPLFGDTIPIQAGVLEDADPDEADASFIGSRGDIGASNGVIHGIDRVLLPLDIPGLGATRATQPIFIRPAF